MALPPAGSGLIHHTSQLCKMQVIDPASEVSRNPCSDADGKVTLAFCHPEVCTSNGDVHLGHAALPLVPKERRCTESWPWRPLLPLRTGDSRAGLWVLNERLEKRSSHDTKLNFPPRHAPELPHEAFKTTSPFFKFSFPQKSFSKCFFPSVFPGPVQSKAGPSAPETIPHRPGSICRTQCALSLPHTVQTTESWPYPCPEPGPPL